MGPIYRPGVWRPLSAAGRPRDREHRSSRKHRDPLVGRGTGSRRCAAAKETKEARPTQAAQATPGRRQPATLGPAGSCVAPGIWRYRRAPQDAHHRRDPGQLWRTGQGRRGKPGADRHSVRTGPWLHRAKSIQRRGQAPAGAGRRDRQPGERPGPGPGSHAHPDRSAGAGPSGGRPGSAQRAGLAGLLCGG